MARGIQRFSLKDKENRDQLLKLYSECGNLSQACHAFNIFPKRVYEQIERMPEFADEVAHAKSVAVSALESEARRRAVEGVTEDRYDKDGNLVGTTTKYSDTLLIFLMKAADPDTYRERHTIEHKGTVSHEHTAVPISRSVAFINDAIGDGQTGELEAPSAH